MSDRLTPGPQAKARIQAHSEKDFLTFFDELPVAGMRRVARFLPAVPGFRPTSSLGIARQKSVLAQKLSRPNATNRDFHGLYLIWREWIDATFKNAATVQELINQVEKAVEGAQDDETVRLSIENKVDALFAKLQEESQRNLCTREQIERLLAFSPLPETSAVRNMMAASKTSADVERDSKFNELPERLQRVEGAVGDTTAQLKTISDRADQGMRSITQALSDIRELRTTVTQSKQNIDDIRGEGQQYAAEHRRLKDELAAKEKTNETRLKSFLDQVTGLRAEIDWLMPQLSNLNRIDESLSKLSLSIADTAERERASDVIIARLQTDIDQLTRDLITVNEDRSINDHVVSLTARVADLESKVTRASVHANAVQVMTAETGENRSILYWEPLTFDYGSETVAIQEFTQIAPSLSATLQSIGLRKQAAEIFGEECAAALIARQVIFLRGEFAVSVGRTLAATVAGPSAVRLSVPLGVDSDDRLRGTINAAFSDGGTQITGLVVEGIDTVPLQILREVIADCVTARRGTLPRSRIAVFATIAGGVASIPIEKTFFELGPVFDVDVLDWRTSYAGSATITPKSLSYTADQGFWDRLANESIDTDEAGRLARLFITRASPAVEQTILRAYRALQLIRRRAAEVTPLQSLFYGWLLPYWHVRQVSRDQADSELDGGKVNGSHVDRRLVALLTDFPDEEQQ
jgi:hypothetical protein